MNPNYDKQLEDLISRELKTLPNLSAPTGLHSRVMAAIEARTAPQQVPWFARSPVARFAVVMVLTVGFAALCYAGWQVRGLSFSGSFTRHIAELWSTAGLLANFLETLGSAVVLILRNLNGIIVTSLCVSAMLVYFLWVALGTLWFKITFATR